MPFFLIVVGLVLVILNIRAVKKEKQSFKNILETTEQDTTEFEIMIGELRREFSETILELQKEIIELKSMINSDKNNLDVLIDETPEVKSKEIVNNNNFDEDFSKVLTNNRRNITKAAIIEDAITDVEKVESENTAFPLNEVERSDSDEGGNSVKIDEIGNLLKNGATVDEICEKLNIGKGEVLLIKELYLK